VITQTDIAKPEAIAEAEGQATVGLHRFVRCCQEITVRLGLLVISGAVAWIIVVGVIYGMAALLSWIQNIL